MAAADAKPTNVYIHRQAGTPKSCFVCYKSSPHVLVSQSIPTLDFLYVCHAHLADRHFATKLSDPASSPSAATSGERLPDKVSQDEIAKIKAEYEAKQKAKEAAKDSDKDKQASKPFTAMGVAGSVFSTVTSTVSGLASSAISSIPGEAPASTAAATTPSPAAAETLAKQHPLHAKYALHREFYAARVREWNNKMVKKKEKELNMPPAPRNALS
ncbi:conserved fungal protein [Pseudozyma hubeiensis SY62]|uniref:Conserved fungal protein n=1 Tax=Pseudozyma hubeiensis (strain SY62) TaxID=1305764 RepID=R9P172_PSEHS|nr:conserved fungal protein [Pseudozyma hubeiensis SY62]GAC95033.1 conserved fungal protein [Pseudozyma hubeiensis SY62]